jgi:hypothetical protein
MIDGKAPDDRRPPSAPQANGHAGAARCVLFLDNQRLTRDCLSEVIREQCPDLHVMGLRPLDFDERPASADIALIIVHLHDAPLSAVTRLAQADLAQARTPPILVITDRDESAASIEAMQRAIAGLVRSDASINLLLAAIRLVIAGGRYYPADTLASLMRKAPLIRTTG